MRLIFGGLCFIALLPLIFIGAYAANKVDRMGR